jgi:hypothetical protein
VLCSIEFVSSSGKLLKQFNLSQCGQAARAAGGINETRGVSRPRLLSVLADQLPPGALRFNSSVVGMSELDGSGGLSTQLMRGLTCLYVACVSAYWQLPLC